MNGEEAPEDSGRRPRLRTMEDLARAVGLSRPTVSKFFANPGSVRESTRQRIEQALRDFDYTPNVLAMNLNRRHPRLIGVVVPDNLDPFFASLIDSVQRHAMARGYLALSESSHGDLALEERAVESLASVNVAGIILAPLGLAWTAERRRWLTGRVPIVTADSRVDEATAFVGTDNGRSIGLMVDYLVRSGSPPAFFAMPPLNTNSLAREAAYADAMRALGLPPHILNADMPYGGWDFESYAREAALALMEEAVIAPGGTVLCANDRLAFGVVSAAFARGLPVGREALGGLRVAGHDDHPLSRFACPPLTTVAQDVETIGRTALEVLLATVGTDADVAPEPPARETRLEARLVLRESA